jgi:hypothetical protein
MVDSIGVRLALRLEGKVAEKAAYWVWQAWVDGGVVGMGARDFGTVAGLTGPGLDLGGKPKKDTAWGFVAGGVLPREGRLARSASGSAPRSVGRGGVVPT